MSIFRILAMIVTLWSPITAAAQTTQAMTRDDAIAHVFDTYFSDDPNHNGQRVAVIFFDYSDPYLKAHDEQYRLLAKRYGYDLLYVDTSILGDHQPHYYSQAAANLYPKLSQEMISRALRETDLSAARFLEIQQAVLQEFGKNEEPYDYVSNWDALAETLTKNIAAASVLGMKGVPFIHFFGSHASLNGAIDPAIFEVLLQDDARLLAYKNLPNPEQRRAFFQVFEPYFFNDSNRNDRRVVAIMFDAKDPNLARMFPEYQKIADSLGYDLFLVETPILERNNNVQSLFISMLEPESRQAFVTSNIMSEDRSQGAFDDRLVTLAEQINVERGYLKWHYIPAEWAMEIAGQVVDRNRVLFDMLGGKGVPTFLFHNTPRMADGVLTSDDFFRATVQDLKDATIQPSRNILSKTPQNENLIPFDAEIYAAFFSAERSAKEGKILYPARAWEDACDKGEPIGCKWAGLTYLGKIGSAAYSHQSYRAFRKACDLGDSETCAMSAISEMSMEFSRLKRVEYSKIDLVPSPNRRNLGYAVSREWTRVESSDLDHSSWAFRTISDPLENERHLELWLGCDSKSLMTLRIASSNRDFVSTLFPHGKKLLVSFREDGYKPIARHFEGPNIQSVELGSISKKEILDRSEIIITSTVRDAVSVSFPLKGSEFFINSCFFPKNMKEDDKELLPQ